MRNIDLLFLLLSLRTFVVFVIAVRVQTRRDFYNKFNIYHQNPWSYKKYKITISLTKYIISIYSKECLSNIYRCEDIKFHSKKTHVKTELKITFKLKNTHTQIRHWMNRKILTSKFLESFQNIWRCSKRNVTSIRPYKIKWKTMKLFI